MTKLDPTNPADWENHGEEYTADMDSFLKDMDEKEIDKASVEVVVDVGDNNDLGKSKSIVRRRKGATPRQAPAKSQKTTKVDIITELNDKEKQDTLKFFKEHIATADVYNIGKAKKQKIEDFFKEQFIETADVFNFLDGDKLKIDLAWNLVAGEIPARIKELEAEALVAKEKKEWTMDEVYTKLSSVGASDEDIEYFFNLIRKERLEILNSSGDELKEHIKNLVEKRKEEDNRNNELARDIEGEKIEKENQIKKENQIEKDNLLIHLGEEVERCRKEYLEKEDNTKIKISRLKKFFKNFVSVDKNYEIEKELEIYKEEYEKALKNYLDAVVEVEKPTDAEEREIVYRYAQFGETLKLMDAKADLKFEKNPYLEAFKRDFSVGTLNLIDKYKELLGKPKELIMKKTDSKILGFGGGMVAVGGAMAFAANYIPGLRDFTRVLSIAVATKGFYSRAESEAVIEKEKSLEEGIEKLERRLTYINDLGAEVDEAFKKEIGFAVENIPEEAMKEKEKVGRRMAWSLIKAIAISTIFYKAGHFIKGYFSTEDLQKVDTPVVVNGVEDGSVSEQAGSGSGAVEKGLKPTAISGSSLHSQASITGTGVKTESIEETINRLGIGADKVASDNATGGYDKPENRTDIFNESKAPELEIKTAEVAEPTDGEKNNRADMLKEAETPTSETKAAETAEPIGGGEKIIGIELDDYGIGRINVIAGKGIKDTLAKLLMENSEKFTEGKMGWDADKYASVEEWADKRATGIVGEFKAQYPDYNFDKVSVGSSIKIDLSNKADIKIVGFNDPYHLGRGSAAVADLEKATAQSNNVNIESGADKPEVANLEKTLAEAEKVTNNEMRVAFAAGVSSAEYAKINNLTVAEFLLNDKNESTRELREIITTIEAKADNSTATISEALRGISDSDMVNLLVDKDLAKFDYSDYLGDIVLEELKAQLNLLSVLNGIKDEKIDVDNAVFKSFKQVVENTLKPAVKFENDSTVGKYMVKSIIKAYEMGKIDNFRVALSHIKL